MTLPVFILGCTKFIQLNEIIMIFNLYELLDKQKTQCFAVLCSSRTKTENCAKYTMPTRYDRLT
jgi:hypothetical protein